MRTLFCLTILVSFAAAGEELLTDPPKSSRANDLHKKAKKIWKEISPLYDKVNAGEKVEVAEIAAAIPKLEDALSFGEKSVELRWNDDANELMVTLTEAWYAMRAKVPPPTPPTNPKAKEKWEKAQKSARNKHKIAARRFLMKQGALRRYQKIYSLCNTCSGRKEIRSGFGNRRPCTACDQRGELPSSKTLLTAWWHGFSPHYRASQGNLSRMERRLSGARNDPKHAGPFLTKLRVLGDPEFHDTWIRVHLLEYWHEGRNDMKRPQKRKQYVDLFRIGRNWYFHQQRFDRKVLDLPPAPEEEEKDK
ncbi:MAG: hypothetical protein V3T86_06125 [Planctomycetota bacterium]